MQGLKKSHLRHALLLSGAVMGATAAQVALAPAYAQAAIREFKIPAQPLADALRSFANQTGRDVLFAPAIVANKTSVGVRGALSEAAALQTLLSGTGLTFQVTSTNGYAVLAQGAAAEPATTPTVKSDGASSMTDEASSANADTDNSSNGNVEKVTVTGSRIRGAKQASPVVTITQDDMKRQGANDLGQAVRGLPQNFNGGQNPGVSGSGGAESNQNGTGSSSINLRGLGPDATLTLLNGTRLPYDGVTQATDVAVIPVAAVERMEVLLDGASAIYGSDAVGGVVNIILKRDYDGAEFSARYGKATDGGFEQRQYTAVAGSYWNSGGFIVTGDYSSNTDVEAGQRDYLSYLPADMSIYPPAAQKGGLLSGHQKIDESVTLTLDAFYTERSGQEFQNFEPFFGINFVNVRESEIWGLAPALRVDLPADWSLRVHGAVGRNQANVDNRLLLPDGTLIGQTIFCYCNRSEAAGLEVEGPLFALPGGDVRFATGSGYRKNTFETLDRLAGGTVTAGKDKSHYVYGEVFLPLVSSEQGIPFLDRFSVSGAVRYENYDSFGETTTPKVGAVWGVTSDIDIKASWGKSFKVPTLSQQFITTTVNLFDANSVGGSGFPAGSGAVFLLGGNPDLIPERADTFATGFVVRPAFFPGFKSEVSRFDINYTDRIAPPFEPFFTALSNPASLSFVTFAPTVAQQNAAFALSGLPVGSFSFPPDPSLLPYDPSRVVAIADGRYANVASQQIRGVDLIASYTTDLWDGSFTTSANATWLESIQKLTPLASEQPISGLVYYPTEFRGRLGATWSRDGLILATFVNRVGGVTNNLVDPPVKGGAMTTVDLTVNYVVESAVWGTDVEFNVAVTNLFDSAPPLFQPPFPESVNYDSTNYSAIGRVVNASVTVRF